MNKLTDYIISLTNLYGLVRVDKVLEIYNMQNEEKISDFDGVDDDELCDNYVEGHGDYFVHESIMELDEFDEQLRHRKGKPFYIPEQEELLKYRDELYFEKTEQYKELMNYLVKNIFNGDEQKAEYLCEDILDICKNDFDIQGILNLISLKANLKDKKQLNEVMQLVIDLSNNTRIWENNGHTPAELFKISEKPNLRTLPKENDNSSNVNSVKRISRNAPCPCGSGNKYKRCCGK